MTDKPIGHCTLEILSVLAHVIPGEDRIPIYTAPPKREWVGLTDDEREAIANSTIRIHGQEWAYATAIEAKLKEKNT